MGKYLKAEKVIIAMHDDSVNTYQCSIHGVFSKRKDVDDKKCGPNCKGEITVIENVNELKEKFKEELGWS